MKDANAPHDADAAAVEAARKGQEERDRRAAERVSVELFVRERDGDRMFVHPALSLSATGIFLESHSYSLRSSLERQYMDLEFELPDDNTAISVRCEVIGTRRLRGFSTGLAAAFIDLTPEQHEAIAAYVKGRLDAGESEGPRDEAAPTAG
jgi:hypothetical protein